MSRLVSLNRALEQAGFVVLDTLETDAGLELAQEVAAVEGLPGVLQRL